MTKIIAFSGRKQSGKTTSANFLFGLQMLSLKEPDKDGNLRPMILNWFKINETGQLVVPAENNQEGIFDPLMVTPASIGFLCENVWPYVKMYYFADALKQEVCIKILGLTYEQCYGTEEQKNSKTKLKWENMPIPAEFISNKEKALTWKPKKGFMTAREVMQYVGTEIFRKIYNDVWVDATLRQVEAEGSELALIGDCRFPNEVEGIHNQGGKVIRFTRNANSDDEHDSETGLDSDKFDWNVFDAIIDNKTMSIDEQNQAVYQKLKEWDYLSYNMEVKDGKIT